MLKKSKLGFYTLANLIAMYTTYIQITHIEVKKQVKSLYAHFSQTEAICGILVFLTRPQISPGRMGINELNFELVI